LHQQVVHIVLLVPLCRRITWRLRHLQRRPLGGPRLHLDDWRGSRVLRTLHIVGPLIEQLLGLRRLLRLQVKLLLLIRAGVVQCLRLVVYLASFGRAVEVTYHCLGQYVR